VVAGVLVTGLIAVATVNFPLRLGLLLAVLAGVGVAVGVESRRPDGQSHGAVAMAADIADQGEVA